MTALLQHGAVILVTGLTTFSASYPLTSLECSVIFSLIVMAGTCLTLVTMRDAKNQHLKNSAACKEQQAVLQ